LPRSLRALNATFRSADVVINHVGYLDPVLRRKKLERDLRLLEMDLVELNEHSFTLFNLGQVYLELSQPERALDFFRRSRQRSDDSDSIVPKLYVLIGACQRQLGQAREALASYEAGLRLYADDAELLFRAAALRLDLGDWATRQGRWRTAGGCWRPARRRRSRAWSMVCSATWRGWCWGGPWSSRAGWRRRCWNGARRCATVQRFAMQCNDLQCGAMYCKGGGCNVQRHQPHPGGHGPAGARPPPRQADVTPGGLAVSLSAGAKQAGNTGLFCEKRHRQVPRIGGGVAPRPPGKAG
jgi:hypothetical protein